MLVLNFRDKDSFFDRQAVIDAVGRANAKNLSKAGAYVRRAARSSLRRRKKSSAPGNPPSIHTDHPFATLKNIWFGFDRQRESVVVGPVRLNRSSLDGSNRSTVPELQELGGSAFIIKRKKRKRIQYAARPFMGPALQKELPKLPGLWANSVK